MHLARKNNKNSIRWHIMAHLGIGWHNGVRYNMPAQNKRKRGDSFGVTDEKASDNILLEAASSGKLQRLLKKYLSSCRPSPDADPKKDPGRLPNLAGFCASLGCGCACLDELRDEFPRLADYLCAVFEDEALNAVRSSTLWNFHFKDRLGYFGGRSNEGEGELQLIFDHDIKEDGG